MKWAKVKNYELDGRYLSLVAVHKLKGIAIFSTILFHTITSYTGKGTGVLELSDINFVVTTCGISQDELEEILNFMSIQKLISLEKLKDNKIFLLDIIEMADKYTLDKVSGVYEKKKSSYKTLIRVLPESDKNLSRVLSDPSIYNINNNTSIDRSNNINLDINGSYKSLIRLLPDSYKNLIRDGTITELQIAQGVYEKASQDCNEGFIFETANEKDRVAMPKIIEACKKVATNEKIEWFEVLNRSLTAFYKNRLLSGIRFRNAPNNFLQAFSQYSSGATMDKERKKPPKHLSQSDLQGD